MYVPYDIETYPNCFTFCAISPDGSKTVVFEISHRKDERQALFKFLGTVRAQGWSLLGYNNVGFDYPVIHYMLTHAKCTVEDIYNKAMDIINTQRSDRFSNIIWDKEMKVPQVDLFKIHHFDNAARATSLKLLEFNMRSDNIEDLPFDVGLVLTDEQIDTLIEYNKHDVRETYKFMLESQDQIKFREKLTEQYQRNFMNYNDTKIGKEYFIMELEKNNKGCCYEWVDGSRKPRQTRRKEINLGECVLDYVEFNTPEFNSILDWLHNTTITQTKESLNDLFEYQLGDVAKYAKMDTKHKKIKLPKGGKPSDEFIADMLEENPKAWIEERPLKSGGVSYWKSWRIANNLNVVLDGFQFDFGTGGIHGSVESQTVLSDDDYLIIDWDVSDVASYAA